jgi:hypothetical protein
MSCPHEWMIDELETYCAHCGTVELKIGEEDE